MHMVGAQHAAPLRSRRPTALLPYPFTRREVDSMTTRRSVLIGTAIVAGLTAAIRRPAPAPGAGAGRRIAAVSPATIAVPISTDLRVVMLSTSLRVNG